MPLERLQQRFGPGSVEGLCGCERFGLINWLDRTIGSSRSDLTAAEGGPCPAAPGQCAGAPVRGLCGLAGSSNVLGCLGSLLHAAMGGSAAPVGGGGAAAGTAAVGARRAAVTTLLMNLASIVERADEGILPAVSGRGVSMHVGLVDVRHSPSNFVAELTRVHWGMPKGADYTSDQSVTLPSTPRIARRCPLQVYMFIGRSLNASLSQLGTLTLVRALFQASWVGGRARQGGMPLGEAIACMLAAES